MRPKKTPTAFLVDNTLGSRTLYVLCCFCLILQLLWLIPRALAPVPVKTIKNAKNDVFVTFAPKISLFSLKTGKKAHTKLQQGKLA